MVNHIIACIIKILVYCLELVSADCAVVRADIIVVFGLVSIAPKQNNVLSTDHLNFSPSAAILGEILSPYSCRFMMLGIPNASPPSETFLVAEMKSSILLSHITPGLSADTVYPS